jgi:type I restriction enzyme S subunit
MSYNQWESHKLGKLATFYNGRAYKNEEFLSYGTPIVRIQNLTGKGKTVYSDLQLDDNKYIKNGDLIFAWSATFGPYIWKGPKSIYHYHIWKIECKEDLLHKEFFFYKLHQITNSLKESGNGTLFVHITKGQMENTEILIPEINQQKGIADILFSLDEKIENNNAINLTLEEIAQTLFKEWFINFNYPNADLNLKSSKFGEIPENWRIGKFSDLVEQVKSNINPSLFSDKKFNHYSLPAFDTNELPKVDFGNTILSNKTAVKKYSVLFSKLNPHIPRIWSIGDVDESNSICSTEFIGFTPKQDFYFSFINYFLKQPELITKLTGIAMGTSNSHQRIKPTDLLELEVFIPDDELVKQFEKIVRPLLETRFHKIQENESLKITRNSLLPKLMSGEIYVGGR